MKFEFASVFEYFRREGRLQERFEKILAILEPMDCGGESGGESAPSAFGRAIASIRRCRDGSYSSLNSAWDSLFSLQDVCARSDGCKLALSEAALQQLRTAIAEADEEMFRLHKHLIREMACAIEVEI